MFTLWFTGSDYHSMRAVAKEVEKFLKAKKLTVVYLDKYNCVGVRHAAYIAELLNKQGVVVVASFYASYLKYRTSVKGIVTKHIEVWVKGADKTHVFAQESCDVLVDLNLNTVQSCASLVASYLYLYEVIKLSKDGIDPIVNIRKSEGSGMENRLRALLNRGIVDSGNGLVKSADGKRPMTFGAIEDLMSMLEGEELRLLKALKDKIFETIKAEIYLREEPE